MNTEQFITALGLSEIADTIHKHPKSGSDYSIRELLEKFETYVKTDIATADGTKVPTAQEHLFSIYPRVTDREDLKCVIPEMIEFAKIHVQAGSKLDDIK